MDTVLGFFQFGPFTAGALLNLLMVTFLVAVLLNTRFKTHRLIFIWIPIIFLAAISITYTSSPIMAIKSTLVLTTYTAAFIIPFHFIKTTEHFIECIKIIVYSSLIPLIAVLFEFVFPEGSTNANGFRLFSTFTHPNIFAFYLVVVFSVCFFSLKSDLMQHETVFKKHCFYICLFALACVLGTKTRSAWAVVGLILFLWGVFADRRYLIFLSLGVFGALMVPSIQERVFDLFQGNDPDAFLNDYEQLNSYAWRKVIWASAITKYWESPIFGFGYMSFANYSSDFFLIATEKGSEAHNTYVQLLFELGILGLSSFLYLLISVLIPLFNAARQLKENVIVLGLFISFCLIHYSDNLLNYLVVNWYFWFFIGSFLAYLRITIVKRHNN